MNGVNNKLSDERVGSIPPFSQTLNGRGLRVNAENEKQGVVSVTGDAYKYEDNKTGLTSIYPSRLDAIQDGGPEEKLQNIALQNEQFIDLSSFGKTNPNPHNFNAMQESKRQGRQLNYAHITPNSPPERVQHFLEMSKKRNEAFGIKGVIVQRQAANGDDPVIRLYSHKSYEKR